MKITQFTDNILEAELQATLEKSQQKVDGLFTQLSYYSALITIVLSAIYGMLFHGIIAAVTNLGLILFVFKYIHRRQIKIALFGALWIGWTAIFIAASNGLFETRFLYFILLFSLVLYQNITPVITASVIALIYNLLIFYFLKNDFEINDFIRAKCFNTDVVSYEQIIWTIAAIIFADIAALLLARTLGRRTFNNISYLTNQKRELTQLDKNKRFAAEIAKGNLNVELEKDDRNELGILLNHMRNSLIQAIEKDRLLKFETDFNNIGVVEIDKVLREQEASINELSKNVLKKLVSYLQVEMGAIYVVEVDNHEHLYLDMKACVAYGNEMLYKKRIDAGEGLVGAVFLERQTVFLTDIPTSYIKITSGLGDANPNCIIITPLISNQEIRGILELASFKVLKEYEIRFIETITEHIAASIATTRINQQTQRLLEESEQLTADKQEKEEELRQNMRMMEENQATTQLEINYLREQLAKAEQKNGEF